MFVETSGAAVVLKVEVEDGYRRRWGLDVNWLKCWMTASSSGQMQVGYSRLDEIDSVVVSERRVEHFS